MESEKSDIQAAGIERMQSRENAGQEKCRRTQEVVVQKILFPQIGKCTEQELYFRQEEAYKEYRIISEKKQKVRRVYAAKDAAYSYSQKYLSLKKGERIGFDTYFNGFSIDKWKKYTVLDNLYLSLTLQGKLKVTLVNKQRLHERVIEKVLSETAVDAASKQTWDFGYDIQSAKGMLTFELEAAEDSILYSGAYCSKVSGRIRNVKLGIGICTFRREEYVRKNLAVLCESILENESSPLYGRMEVFIADNGRTLDAEELRVQGIHIYPNRNLGGAGGFTRTLIEMKKGNRRYGITHALLMDDDVVIEPEALVKTYMILALAKENYTGAFIGGAMLRLDQQTVQTEAGAAWNMGFLNSMKAGLELGSCEACLLNEVEESAQYNAWWYCCFPIGIITEKNLPLPLFIRGDDVEYGLRNMKQLILMNGICVWHEPFENKYSSFLEYYIIRNQLITNAFHCTQYGAGRLNRVMISHCFREITYYRYKNVDLYLQGIKDFMKGPKWLMAQDGEKLHKKVVQAGYQAADLDKLDMGFIYREYEKSRKDYGQYSSRKKRFLTLNGLLLPAIEDNVTPMAGAIGVHFYRKRRVMHYDEASGRAFITERSFVKTVKYIYRVMAMCLINRVEWKRTLKKYRRDGKRLRMLCFWKDYLGLD